MLAQEFTAVAEARIQEEIARFLALKSTIVRLQGSQNPIVRDQADQLYRHQLSLEEQLQDTLKRIENIKKGAYTMSDVTAVGSFSYALREHIQQVNKLARQVPAEAMISMPMLVVGGLALAGAAFMLRGRAKGGRRR